MKKSDTISTLPQSIIEKILSHMPIRDAVRTSILSNKWRYWWTGIPKLVFDDNMVANSYLSSNKYKLLNAIFHVLLLHKGPILEFHLWITNASLFKEIDQIILHLSWSKSIKEFCFESAFYRHKIPFSLFSMQGLECLQLTKCKIELPSTFNGFSMLKSLYFEDVMITANMFQRFLTSCPLLEDFTLAEGTAQRNSDFIGGNECSFLDLFKCLPSIQNLRIAKFYMEHFAAASKLQRLPTSLPQLKGLLLDVCFQKQDELLSALWVINSSPNLAIISIKMVCKGKETSNNLLDPQDYSGLKLDHLKNLEIESFHNYATEMEFVKLIMAKSPVLEKARIELDASVSVDEENMMLQELQLQPLPRASPAANFIIQCPKI